MNQQRAGCNDFLLFKHPFHKRPLLACAFSSLALSLLVVGPAFSQDNAPKAAKRVSNAKPVASHSTLKSNLTPASRLLATQKQSHPLAANPSLNQQPKNQNVAPEPGLVQIASPVTSSFQTAPPTQSQAKPPVGTKIEPSIVTLNLGNGVSQDLEIVQWPNGGFALPVRAITALFGIVAQQPSHDHRLLFLDPVSGKKVELNWDTQQLTVDDKVIPLGAHPLMFSEQGLINPNDVYLDQSVLGSLLQTQFTFNEDTTTLSIDTHRKLSIPAQSGTPSDNPLVTADIQLINQPKVYRAVLEKVYVRNTSNYLQQMPKSLGGSPFRNSTINSMSDSSMVGVSGSLWGQNYYLKPTFTRFNNRLNLQSLDWSIQHDFKNSIFSLGSSDAGLSALSSPSLNLWGFKWASKNATGPYLLSKPNYEFSGPATQGHQIQARINGRTIQSTVAQENGYALESVYLQPQAINHLQIVELDEQKHETVLVDKKIANYLNLLPKGEEAYSGFIGRAPLLFYPPVSNTNSSWLMPQSNKWLAGGRAFYGLTDRLTVGTSVVADRVLGKPHTYYTSLDPFSIDLTGINSYIRDANFFQGENISATVRYQLRDRWLVSADTGISRFTLLPGSHLPIENSNMDMANQVHLERQGSRMTWFLDAFRYGSNYYTPSVMLYGNNLYDKRGLSTGVTGVLSRLLRLNYNVKWNHYQTNFKGLITGGVIDANQWNASLNSHINDQNDVMVGLNWIQGENHARHFDQHALDFTWRTQSLPWRLTGEVRASHYYTNTIFYPSSTIGFGLSQANYTNNALDFSVNIPLNKARTNYLKIGNRISTFVDYGFAQASFKIRKFTFEPLVQISFGNRPQIQNRFGLKVGYQLNSGALLSLGFYKNFSTFATSNALGNGFQSRFSTNQLYWDFSDIFSLFGKKVRSLGPNSDSNGILTGKIFADYRPNGKSEQHEPGVHAVHLLIDKEISVQTDNKGYFLVPGLATGYHTVEVQSGSLPLTLGLDRPAFKIKINSGKTHRLDIPLTPEGGNLSGMLQLTNIQGKTVPPKEIILVLTDTQGKLLGYTTPDADGHYQFSNLATGRYQIDLEPKLKASGRYRVTEAPPVAEISIPKSYEESVNIKNQDMKLLAL